MILILNTFQEKLHVPGLAILLTSFLLSILLVPMIRKIAQHYGVVAIPSTRKSHTNNVPVMGGVAISLVLFVSFLLVFKLYEIPLSELDAIDLFYLSLGSFTLLTIGFIDDLKGLKPIVKLFFQILVAYFVVCESSSLLITSMDGLFGIFELDPLFACFLSIFVFVVFVNMLNLIDGIDGLASGISLVSFIFFAYISFLTSNYLNLFLSIACIGAVLPFIYYNVFSTRKIFLGDNGSLFLGVILVYLSLHFLSHDSTDLNIIGGNRLVILMSLFSYPLVDTLRVFLVRILRNKSPFSADKNHIHHHLLRLGLSHRKATLVVILYTVFITIFSLLFIDFGINTAFLLMLVIASFVISLPSFLTKNDDGSISFRKKA